MRVPPRELYVRGFSGVIRTATLILPSFFIQRTRRHNWSLLGILIGSGISKNGSIARMAVLS
jgi:hypothetical protein